MIIYVSYKLILHVNLVKFLLKYVEMFKKRKNILSKKSLTNIEIDERNW